jgi:hypothetical protein
MRYNKLNLAEGRRGARRRVPFWRVAVPVAVLIVAALMYLAHPFIRAAGAAVSHIEEGKALLDSAERSVRQLDLRTALDELSSASYEFEVARAELDRLQPLAGVPYIGKRIGTSVAVVDSGIEAISGMTDALEAADDILSVLGEGEDIAGALIGILPDSGVAYDEMTQENKRDILAALERNADGISSAVEKLESALATLEALPEGVFGGDLGESLETAQMRIASLYQALSSVEPAARMLPGLLGLDQDRHYLLFFMNNTELRPTGGFLGVYGTVTVRDAEIISMDSSDVYRLDGPSESAYRPAPPAPIQKYIRIDKWYLRDANWSPDFPTSAEVMERFYHEEAAYIGEDVPEIDGIIAFTPEVVSDVLRIVGPVTVQEKTFSADDFTAQLEYVVERGFVEDGTPFFARKDIIGVLMDELIDRVTSLSLTDLFRVVNSVENNFEESHAVAYMKDSAMQEFVLTNDWGGEMRPVAVDYISVIDANLAALKSDHAIDRSIRYGLFPAGDGGYEAQVSITYDHHGSFDWKTTRYRTYTRVYVPSGSELISVEGSLMDDKLRNPAGLPGEVDTYQELDRTAFGTFTSVEPGTTGTLSFRYRLPSSVASAIASGRYVLTVEKQPGTEAHGLTLDLDFGKKLTDAAPAEDPSEWGDDTFRYSTNLLVDRDFSVEMGGN